MLTTSEIRKLLAKLDGEPADALESETVECKAWNPDPAAARTMLREVRETVVAFANARGGVLLLGVADRKRTKKEAIVGVGDLQISELRKTIYDGTEPRVLVDAEELLEPEGRIIVVRIPRGLPPHTTTEGVGKIRIGKESKPLTGSDLARLLTAGGERDLTRETVPGLSDGDLDDREIELLRRYLRATATGSAVAELKTEELLRALDLVTPDGDVTLAAVLLVGSSGALSRFVPQHEIVYLRFRSATRYDVRQEFRGPLLSVIEELQRILEAHLSMTTSWGGGFGELSIPALTWWAAREATLNALVHRDYFLRQAVQVELHADRFVVTSPGGFIGGVSPSNILRHPPVRRNPLLAGVLQRAELVNKAGVGVDRIYEELLKLGKGMPRYEADEGHVSLTLPLKAHEAFARFVAEEIRQGRQLGLDDLILLRGLVEAGQLDRWTAAERLQLTEEDAAERLISLRESGYLVVRGRGAGTAYRLRHDLSDRLRGVSLTDLDSELDGEAVSLRVEAVLAERKKLTNADVRRISGYSRPEAQKLMRRLVEADRAVLQGAGRGAHYIPGPQARKGRKGRAE